jgi:site-specific recombinase XerC
MKLPQVGVVQPFPAQWVNPHRSRHSFAAALHGSNSALDVDFRDLEGKSLFCLEDPEFLTFHGT